MPPHAKMILARTAMGLGVSLLLLRGSLSQAPAAPPAPAEDDPLPPQAVARFGGPRLRDPQTVIAAAFAADGKTLATASNGRSIAFWDPATGKEIRRVPIKIAVPYSVLRFSADTKALIHGDIGGTIRFVDTATGAEQRRLDYLGHGNVWGLDVSRDGKILAAAYFQETVVVWDVGGGKRLREFTKLPRVMLPQLVALTPDGKQLVLPHADGSLRLMDAASGKEARAIERPPGGRVQRVAVSPDGRHLACSDSSGRTFLCDPATGKRVRELMHPKGEVGGVAFTPDGRLLAVHTPKGISLCAIASGKEVRLLPAPPGSGPAMIFAPDGRTLAAVGGGCCVRLWDVAAGKPLHAAAGHTSWVQALVFFPDGKRLASASGGHLIVWDIAGHRDLAQRRGEPLHAHSVGVADDGRRLQFIGYDRAIHRWDPATGREEQKAPLRPTANVYQVLLSADGQTAAMTTYNTRPHLFLRDRKGVEQAPALPEKVWVNALRLSPDGGRLAALCTDGALRLWDRATGKPVGQRSTIVPSPEQSRVDFAGDGRSLAVRDGHGLVRILEVASGQARMEFRLPGVNPLLAYSPDGRFLVRVWSGGDLLVYGTGMGKVLARWKAGPGDVQSLAFSRDGRLLASGSSDGSILVWKMPDGEGLSATLSGAESASLWESLGDADAGRANRALAGLAAAPAQALPLIKARFRPPPKPLDPPDAARLARLAADLDSDTFKVRERASRELAAAGPAAAEALRKALAGKPSAEAKRRITDLLDRLDKGGAYERLRCLRALEVLERIGTPEAKEVLRELARKALPAELDEEVHASLRRMGERP